MKKIGLTVLFLFIFSYLGYLGWKIYTALEQAEHKAVEQQKAAPQQKTVRPKKTVVESPENTLKVNPDYREGPETQIMWMERAQTIALEQSAGANRAEFKETFYHRGFAYRPVACGQIQLWQDESMVADYQRFVYVGVRSVHFENDVKNFDIYWNKMCVQTMPDPR